MAAAAVKRKSRYKMAQVEHLRRWLSAVRAVIEGRAPTPGAEMAEPLRQACMARPPISDGCSASASAMINAAPARVWDAVHSPDAGRFVGTQRAIYSGYVPGTPQGQEGEMQYFIHDGQYGKQSGVVVVTDTSGQRSSVTHELGGIVEQQYLLSSEFETGPTRLDLTSRWPAPTLADSVKVDEGQMTEVLRQQVSDYKSLIEAGGLPA